MPDPGLLRLAAAGAAARGPHAHGWVTMHGPVHRALGPLDPATVPASACGLILGHARLATYGQLADVSAVQPVEASGHHLVHNGNAPAVYRRSPDLPSDSAALAVVYATYRATGMPPLAALDRTVTVAQAKVWVIAVYDADGSLVASRNGQPLHLLPAPSGLYLSSGELPGSELMPEQQACLLGPRLREAVNG